MFDQHQETKENLTIVAWSPPLSGNDLVCMADPIVDPGLK
jgi:hypothetical protein